MITGISGSLGADSDRQTNARSTGGANPGRGVWRRLFSPISYK